MKIICFQHLLSIVVNCQLSIIYEINRNISNIHFFEFLLGQSEDINAIIF